MIVYIYGTFGCYVTKGYDDVRREGRRGGSPSKKLLRFMSSGIKHKQYVEVLIR